MQFIRMFITLLIFCNEIQRPFSHAEYYFSTLNRLQENECAACLAQNTPNSYFFTKHVSRFFSV